MTGFHDDFQRVMLFLTASFFMSFIVFPYLYLSAPNKNRLARWSSNSYFSACAFGWSVGCWCSFFLVCYDLTRSSVLTCLLTRNFQKNPWCHETLDMALKCRSDDCNKHRCPHKILGSLVLWREYCLHIIADNVKKNYRVTYDSATHDYFEVQKKDGTKFVLHPLRKCYSS